jgi:hypothetical protein
MCLGTTPVFKPHRPVSYSKEMAMAALARSQFILAEGAISLQFELGRRVLPPTTRRFADRSQHLILAWALMGAPQFARRIVDDLIAVTAFPDWNRARFLDVAEMATAVATVRQWKTPLMSSERKSSVDRSVIEKGAGSSGRIFA